MNTTRPFFKELKDLRESRGIKIEEITERTKINPRYFEAIENGDFAVLPNVYMRLFLRSYAIEIGAEAEKALEDYELFTTGKVAEKVEVKPKPIARDEIIEEDNILVKLLTPKYAWRAVILVAVIILFVLIFNMVGGLLQEQRAEVDPVSDEQPVLIEESDVDGELDAEPVAEEITAPVPAQEQLPSSQDMAGGVVFAYDKYEGSASYRLPIEVPFKFEIESTERTRAIISTPSSVLFQGIMEADTNQEFAFNDTLQFDIWSASHVTIKINDIDLTAQLTNNNKAIRASIIEDGSLSIQFYGH